VQAQQGRLVDAVPVRVEDSLEHHVVLRLEPIAEIGDVTRQSQIRMHEGFYGRLGHRSDQIRMLAGRSATAPEGAVSTLRSVDAAPTIRSATGSSGTPSRASLFVRAGLR
jgi:hypothetical protein